MENGGEVGNGGGRSGEWWRIKGGVGEVEEVGSGGMSGWRGCGASKMNGEWWRDGGK